MEEAEAIRSALAVYVVWHPDAPLSAGLARAMFRELYADPEVPSRRALGIPVWFRTALAGGVPPAVQFGTASRTAVFVLADDTLVADDAWRSYVDHLVDASGPDDLVVAVALTTPANLPPQFGATQAIRLHDIDPDELELELLNNAKNDLCRLLKPDASKVKVFLSHAKHDGLGITTQVREYLHERTKLDDFFDAADVPDGARFAEFLTASIGAQPVLVAVQTDSYASREWCRLEVLEAKRRRVPIVVLAAIQQGETRAFPYLGNVPVVCWRGHTSLPVVVGALLTEVLRDRYFPERVRALCQLRGIDMAHEVSIYPPELLSVLVCRLNAQADGTAFGRYLYPDPPLGAEELLLLHQFDPNIDPITPTVLMAT